MILERNKQVSVAGNHEYKETVNINSLQSSLKSHPLWVTMELSRTIHKGSTRKGVHERRYWLTLKNIRL